MGFDRLMVIKTGDHPRRRIGRIANALGRFAEFMVEVCCCTRVHTLTSVLGSNTGLIMTGPSRSSSSVVFGGRVIRPPWKIVQTVRARGENRTPRFPEGATIPIRTVKLHRSNGVQITAASLQSQTCKSPGAPGFERLSIFRKISPPVTANPILFVFTKAADAFHANVGAQPGDLPVK